MRNGLENRIDQRSDHEEDDPYRLCASSAFTQRPTLTSAAAPFLLSRGQVPFSQPARLKPLGERVLGGVVGARKSVGEQAIKDK